MNIKMKKVGIDSSDIVQKILNSAPFFYLKTEGDPRPPLNGAQEAMTELPPNTSPDKKHFFAFCDEDNTPFGICDLYIGYPDEKTAFLGLLLLDESYQKRRFGRKCFSLVVDYVKNFEQIQKIQLGFIENNPVEGFWNKMGFERNGRSRPHEGKFIKSTVFVMEKSL